ncbi:hypothetical protein [Micrococcus sp.]|uniref:hypothetical protein n=1 Tax=Micrococcus sp. TaxID=1271 RepID=UPI002A915072|nr:hypothetical protein [Micrococcus sp.]MDY6054374.1 hypothetical protein [Micrococcus sp.]
MKHAHTIQDQLGLRPVEAAPWWAPAPGTPAAAVQAVVRGTVATIAAAGLLFGPDLAGQLIFPY